ncbi:hypothetical protein L1275_001982 [Flavobacterium sp. HSC-61S13]|nr:hypothetical protein [Flavobacterium sp. HSC-61S13]
MFILTLIMRLIMALIPGYNYVSPTGLCFDKFGMIIPKQS